MCRQLSPCLSAEFVLLSSGLPFSSKSIRFFFVFIPPFCTRRSKQVPIEWQKIIWNWNKPDLCRLRYFFPISMWRVCRFGCLRISQWYQTYLSLSRFRGKKRPAQMLSRQQNNARIQFRIFAYSRSALFFLAHNFPSDLVEIVFVWGGVGTSL